MQSKYCNKHGMLSPFFKFHISKDTVLDCFLTQWSSLLYVTEQLHMYCVQPRAYTASMVWFVNNISH